MPSHIIKRVSPLTEAMILYIIIGSLCVPEIMAVLLQLANLKSLVPLAFFHVLLIMLLVVFLSKCIKKKLPNIQ